MEQKNREQLVTLDEWKTYAHQLEQQIQQLKQEVEAIETRDIAELNDLIQQSASEALVQQMFRELEENSDDPSGEESWFALLEPEETLEKKEELTRDAADVLLEQVFANKPEFRYLKDSFLNKVFKRKNSISWYNGSHYRNVLQRKKEYLYDTPLEAMDEMIKDYFVRL